jgi:hypothetical protein
LVYQSTDTPEDPDWPVTTYSGSLFGYTITVELGRLLDAYEDCAWRLTVTKGAYFSEQVIVPIDHEIVSSLDVDGIEIADITGPDGCTGTLALGNAEIGRIPFVQKPDSLIEFIDLDPPCGECEQLCSVLCVSFGRYFQEFDWFDYGGSRGWSYTRPGSSPVITDYIYLEEDAYGNCVLSFDIDGVTIPDQTIDIDQGCACGIKEVVTGAHVGGSTEYTLRCGPCSCWEFLCGTCRCVPRYVCVQSYIDGTFTANQVLAWDEDDGAWLGSVGENSLALYVERAEDGGCEIVPVINGYRYDADSLVSTLDCGTEHLSSSVATKGRQLDRTNDFVAGTVTYTDDDTEIWIRFMGPSKECEPGPCGDATPCRDECGSHPAQLTALLHGYSDSYDGDEPGYDDVECDLEITLYYWERFDWTGSLEATCGYVGWAYIGQCGPRVVSGGPYHTWLRVELVNGNLDAYWVQPDGDGELLCYQATLTESCDPYYGDSGVDTQGLITCCWECTTTIQRIRTTVTE